MEGELEKLENEAVELQNKIDVSNDFFFIYGWERRLTDVKDHINRLKSIIVI